MNKINKGGHFSVPIDTHYKAHLYLTIIGTFLCYH